MELTTVVQIMIGMLVGLCALILSDIKGEIKNIRERLHKLEGQEGLVRAHIGIFNQWISEAKELAKRITEMEISVSRFVK